MNFGASNKFELKKSKIKPSPLLGWKEHGESKMIGKTFLNRSLVNGSHCDVISSFADKFKKFLFEFDMDVKI